MTGLRPRTHSATCFGAIHDKGVRLYISAGACAALADVTQEGGKDVRHGLFAYG